MPRIVQRDFGTSLYFNGSTSQVSDGVNYTAIASAHSITGWFKLAPGVTQTQSQIISFGTSANMRSGITVDTTPGSATKGRVRSGFYNGTVYTSASGFVQGSLENAWHNFVYIWDGSSAKIYVDGILGLGGVGPISSAPAGLIIGAQSGAFWKGNIDAVSVYSRALTDDEANRIYYRGIIPTAGLYRRYRFNEGSGTVAVDESPNTANATIANAIYSTDVAMKPRAASLGKIALVNLIASGMFNGSTSQVIRSGITSQMNSAYSISAWVKRGRSRGAAESIFRDSVGDKLWFNFNGTTDDVRIYHDDLTPKFASTTPFAVRDYEWHYYTATYDGSTIRIYIDGVERKSQAVTGTLSMSGDLRIGFQPYFLGQIDEVRIFSRTLSQSEITSLYVYNTLLNVSGQLLYYKLNEGIGTSVVDYSGNSNNAVSSNLIYTVDTPIKIRQPISPNIVRNGNFDITPPIGVATTAISSFIDGTASGTSNVNNNTFGNWALISGQAGQFDQGGIKLTVSTGSVGEISNVLSNTGANVLATNQKVEPNTTYSVSFRMKTEFTGTATTGAYFAFTTNSVVGGTITAFTTPGVKTTTEWTPYSFTFTTNASARFSRIRLLVTGSDGAATLAGSAWFDDIVVTPTVPVTRQTP